jgi:protein-S-isoprenylcysteine O-methyltransferase Ste14
MRRVLDALERVVVLTLYILLLYRFRLSLQANWLNIVYLVGDGLIVAMLLVRRATDQISVNARDWLFGFIGSFASMMIYPGNRIDALIPLAAFLMFGGFLIGLTATLSLNRSFGVVAANRGVKTAGAYEFVRHPMYLGYFLSQAAMLILNFSLWNVVLLSTWAVFQILRINAEEHVLIRDPAYQAYKSLVRYRLVPLVY